MDDETVEGVAYANTARFGVVDDAYSFLQVSILVKVGMANAGTSFYDRYRRFLADEVYETFGTSWNDDVHVAVGMEHLTGRLMGGWQQFDDMLIHIVLPEYFLDDADDGTV